MIRQRQTSRPRWIARLVTVATIAIIAVGSPAARTDAAPRQFAAAEEQAFVTQINNLRISQGLAPLQVHPELQAAAREWAVVMKNRGEIFHASDLSIGISANWQKLGENVGVGGTVPSLHDAFVASPSHYRNLVDPAFTTIGVGVVWDGERMFTAHRFMAEMPGHSQPSPEPTPEPEPEPEPEFYEEPPPTAPPETTAPPTTAPPAPTIPPPSASHETIVADATRLISFGA